MYYTRPVITIVTIVIITIFVILTLRWIQDFWHSGAWLAGTWLAGQHGRNPGQVAALTFTNSVDIYRRSHPMEPVGRVLSDFWERGDQVCLMSSNFCDWLSFLLLMLVVYLLTTVLLSGIGKAIHPLSISTVKLLQPITSHYFKCADVCTFEIK